MPVDDASSKNQAAVLSSRRLGGAIADLLCIAMTLKHEVNQQYWKRLGDWCSALGVTQFPAVRTCSRATMWILRVAVVMTWMGLEIVQSTALLLLCVYVHAYRQPLIT
jgi:hypothetical protein